MIFLLFQWILTGNGEPCQRIRANIGTKQQSSLNWFQRTMNTFHWTQPTAMFNVCLIECFLWEKEETLQQVRANTERRRQSSRTWIVPEFHQLAIVTPQNPPCHHLNVKIQTRGIYMCLWLLQLPDDTGISHGTLQNIHFYADLRQHWDKTIEWSGNEKYYIYFHESCGNRSLKMVVELLEDHH